ncbi:MAG TPA: branched-chain amino acid ABC transporter substrate-binding protein [Gaiellaceae bacterium]|jgi:branched-chain amino acid transport system substrate-binding protein|nr:branched-chain amino acid ABC transporter substrate-binding protein [Gaiellaceae bacterium]
MVRKAALIVAGAAVASLALVVSGVASSAVKSHAAAPAGPSCANPIQIGMMGPFTGPVASIGDDQLHWAEFFAAQWNKSHPIKINLVQGDTQLNPALASTVAQSFASNSSIVGVIGPAGSDEVTAVAPVLKKAGLAFASGSATNVKLTAGSNKGYFFRDVPNDDVQAPTDAAYMMSHLGVTKGGNVMVIDDQESYSTGLADAVQAALKAKGVNVDRESVSQKSTDFSSLVAKVSSSTKVVFVPFQLASEAQLLAQQLKSQGKSAVVFGSDGTFDSSKFNASGNYVSFFAPDVTTIKADSALVAAYHKQFPGGTSPFGAPNYVLAQMYATAAVKACGGSTKGTVTRAALRAAFAKVKLPSTILGTPVSFSSTGDIAGAKFHIFKIENGKYVTVA